MRLRPVPRAATWLLREYYPSSPDESVVGDLTEQYQRGRGRVWYWRQVLAIVLVGLFRGIWQNPKGVVGGLIKAWFVRGILHFGVFIVLLPLYRSRLHRITANGFPLLTIGLHGLSKNGTSARIDSEIQWPLTVLTVFVGLIILGMIGMDLASSSRVHPRTLVLAYLTLFVAATIASIATHTLELFLNQPNALGYLLLDLFALPVAPAVLLWGASLRKKATEARSVAF